MPDSCIGPFASAIRGRSRDSREVFCLTPDQAASGDRRRFSRLLALLTAAGVWLSPALSGGSPTPDPFGELLQHSPFSVASASNTPAGPAGETLEFRSVVQEAGRTLFSIHDPATRRSVWLALHEESKGFSVQSYDPGRDRVSVAYQGRVLTLPLKRSVVLAQAEQVPDAAKTAATVPPSDKAIAAKTSAPKTRAELVREELARRRAQRGLPAIPAKSAGTRG